MAFFDWLEHTRFSVWIDQSGSVFAYPTILLFHTLGLTLLVGINIAIDLRLLGFAPRIPVGEMRKLFGVMWAGLIISATSGTLLLSAKATRMIANPAFWVKMSAIVLALGAFMAIRSKVFRDPQLDARGIQPSWRLLAVMSIALWFAAITAGRVMAYVGEAAEFGG